MQMDRPGEGRPVYSKNHVVRQRWSVARMLCPMCGEPTPEDDRWTLTARRTSAGAMRRQGLGPLLPAELKEAAVMIDAGAVAPLHRACADRSASQCPHLRGRSDQAIEPFPARWIVAPLWIEGRQGMAAAPVALVSFLQLFGLTGEIDKRWRKAIGRGLAA